MRARSAAHEMTRVRAHGARSSRSCATSRRSLVALGLAACQGCRSHGHDGRRHRARPPTATRPPCASTSCQRPRRRARAVRLHQGPARGPRPLRRLGEAARQLRAPNALVASAGPLFFMDAQLERERADQDRIKARDDRAGAARRSSFAAFAPGRQRLGRRGGGADEARRRAGGAPRARRPATAVRARGRRGEGRLRRLRAARRRGRRRRERRGRRSSAGVEDAKRQGRQVLVALAAVGRGEAKRIADAVPELTAVVVGSAEVERRHEHDRAAGRAGGRRAHRAGGQPPAERGGARPLRARAARARATS